MRVVIVGAGSVGRSIATELVDSGHQVLLIDKEKSAMRISSVTRAEWLLGDGAEVSTLEQARLGDCDVAVAATGDDKVNLVVSLLAKTQYAVPRVVARVNNPKNEWLFDETWGVDVPVSTPRIMTALVEEAVAVGEMVRIFQFHQSGASLYELTLSGAARAVGERVGAIQWPSHTTLATVVRAGAPLVPTGDDTLQVGDELLLVCATEDAAALDSVRDLLVG